MDEINKKELEESLDFIQKYLKLIHSVKLIDLNSITMLKAFKLVEEILLKELENAK